MPLVEALALLRRNPILGLGDVPSLRRLAVKCEVRLFDTRETLTRAGSAQRHVIMIASGRVELHRRNRQTRTQFLVGLLQAPQIFGDAELYAGRTWSISSRAVEPTTVVLMPNVEFDQLVSSNTAVAAALYRDACARHMLVIEIMQFLALQRTEHQIMRLLFDLAPPAAPGEPVVAPLSQIRLAQALGLNRRTISRNLKTLEKHGLLKVQGSRASLLVKREVLALDDLLTTQCHGASWRLGDVTRGGNRD